MELSQFGGKFGNGRRQRTTESRVLTLQSVYIPEGNFSPWGGSRAGGPTCRWGLSVVDGPTGAVAAPGHVGGTHTHKLPADKPLELFSVCHSIIHQV